MPIDKYVSAQYQSIYEVVSASPDSGLVDKSLLLPVGKTFVVHGDSRVQDGGVGNQLVARGWQNHLTTMMQGRLLMLNNAGIGGNGSNEMLARLDADVISYKPDWCFLMGPVNDFIATRNYTVAQTISNVTAMYERCRDNGIRFATATIGPWVLYNTPVIKQKHNQYNNWLKNWCYQNGIPCVDEYSIMAAPSTGQLPSSNMSYDSGSNGHYSGYGASLVAKGWFDVLDPLIPPAPSRLSTSPTDYGNLFYGVNGDIAVGGALKAGWTEIHTTVGASTVSIVARPDNVPGTLVQCVYTGVAGDQGKYFGISFPYMQWGVNRSNSENITAVGARRTFSDGKQYVCTVPGACAASQPSVAGLSIGDSVVDGAATFVQYENFTVGDTIVADVEFFISGGTSTASGAPGVFFQSSGTANDIRLCTPVTADANIKAPYYPLSQGILTSKPFTITAGLTGHNALVVCYIDVGATITFQIGRISYRKYI